MVNRFEIINGPGIGDLMMALISPKDGMPRQVDFTITEPAEPSFPPNGATVFLVIRQVGRETPDFETFNFEGHYPGTAANVPAIGVYNVEKKTGWVEF